MGYTNMSEKLCEVEHAAGRHRKKHNEAIYRIVQQTGEKGDGEGRSPVRG